MFARKPKDAQKNDSVCRHPSEKVTSTHFMAGGKPHLSVKTSCALCDTVLGIDTKEMKGNYG